MGRGTVYNELYTKEKWEKVNEDNKTLLEDFLRYKKSSDKSPETIKQYYQMIRFFFIWNLDYNKNKFFVDIKKREFINFFSYAVETMGWSSNRTATVKSSLSSLSNYIENILDDEFENYRNIVSKIETAVKQPVRDKTILTEEEIKKCLDKLIENKKYQIACYFALAVASGSRKAELLRFKVNYFDDKNIIYGCLYKTPEMIKTKGRSSRGKMLYKYIFVKMFKPYFEAWMNYRKLKGIESEWLFVNKKPNGEYVQANINMIDNWCNTISNYLGKTFYSHAARHRYVTMMKESKLPDEIIVELVGWQKGSGGTMISIYNDSDVSSLFSDYFDENGIKQVEQGKLNDL